MKKTLALLLCVLMLVSVALASCGEETEESKENKDESKATDTSKADTSEESSAPVIDDDPYRDETGKYVDKNIDKYFDPAWQDYGEFKVMVYSNEQQDTYFSEEIESLYDTTDDKIIEAVNLRNAEIEDKYGIKVKAVPVKSVPDEMRKLMASSNDVFDAAMPFMASAATFAQNGDLYDLTEFDCIDFDAPWWDQNANESLSIAGRIFFTTGDLSIMQNIVSNGIAFNKKLLADNFPDVNLYELVRKGEWTIDKFYEMCKEFTRQGDDNEKMDENDIWGSMGGSDVLYFGSGETICGKDADDLPVLTIGSDNQRSIDVAQKVLGYLEEKGTWYVTVKEFTDRTDIWGRTVKIFGEDQALFDIFCFSALKKFRAYDVVYGIVPVPKYNEEQDRYFSKCVANSAYGVCIPLNVRDADFSAFMLELLAVGGKNYLSSAYKTAVLKGKDANTEDDEEMLGIIFDSIVYDPAIVYAFGDINNIFTTATSGTLISKLEELSGPVDEAINKIVEAYDSIG